VLVHRLGGTRGSVNGLPVFDVAHQVFVVARGRLGQNPWGPELNLSEHYELFLTLKEHGLKSTRLSDVVVQHRQELPPGYKDVREGTRRYADAWLVKRGLKGLRIEGELFRPSDRLRYELPATVAYTAHRAARVGPRVVGWERAARVVPSLAHRGR
jgi:hypothetical protein